MYKNITKELNIVKSVPIDLFRNIDQELWEELKLFFMEQFEVNLLFDSNTTFHSVIVETNVQKQTRNYILTN